MGTARWIFVFVAVGVAAGATALSVDTLAAGPGSSPCSPAVPAVPGVTEGSSIPGTVAPSLGTLRAAYLLVHPSDAPPDEAVSPQGELIDSIAAWYRAVSYGRLDFRIESPGRWLALPGSSQDYALDVPRYLRDAVAAADPYVDFSQVDVVYLASPLHTPVAVPTSANLFGFGARADGRDVNLWVPLPPGSASLDPDPYLVLHETGHLLGLPDLYVRGAGRTFHRWDLMAARYPAELLAWHRWKLGWLGADQIVCVTSRATTVVTLTPLERAGGNKAVFVQRGKRILAVEVRAREGYDSTLCERGVLVYEVDQTQFRRTPVQLYTAQPDRHAPRRDCAPRWNAPFDIGRHEVRKLQLPRLGVSIQLLARTADGSYRIRIVSVR